MKRVRLSSHPGHQMWGADTRPHGVNLKCPRCPQLLLLESCGPLRRLLVLKWVPKDGPSGWYQPSPPESPAQLPVCCHRLPPTVTEKNCSLMPSWLWRSGTPKNWARIILCSLMVFRSDIWSQTQNTNWIFIFIGRALSHCTLIISSHPWFLLIEVSPGLGFSFLTFKSCAQHPETEATESAFLIDFTLKRKLQFVPSTARNPHPHTLPL